MKKTGKRQFNLVKEVGGVTAAAISRQIDVLGGNTKTEAGEFIPGHLQRNRANTSRVNNQINLTPEGQAFAKEFAEYMNTLLERATR